MSIASVVTRGYGTYALPSVPTTLVGFDAADIITMAAENAGYDAQQLHAGHMKQGVKLLNTILDEWSNLKLIPWAMDRRQIDTVKGDYDYTLANDVIDILPGATLSVSGTDIPLSFMSREDFEGIPQKLVQDQPHTMWLWRKEPPVLYLYPTPDAVYTLNYWVVRRLYGVTELAQDVDISSRWINAIRKRLALEMFDAMPAKQRIESMALRPSLAENATSAFAAMHHGNIEEASWFTR